MFCGLYSRATLNVKLVLGFEEEGGRSLTHDIYIYMLRIYVLFVFAFAPSLCIAKRKILDFSQYTLSCTWYMAFCDRR